MKAGKIESALKNVIEEKLSELREKMAHCTREGQPVDDLEEQIRLIDKLRESHDGRPRTRIV